jgi:hypothetical protein
MKPFNKFILLFSFFSFNLCADIPVTTTDDKQYTINVDIQKPTITTQDKISSQIISYYRPKGNASETHFICKSAEGINAILLKLVLTDQNKFMKEVFPKLTENICESTISWISDPKVKTEEEYLAMCNQVAFQDYKRTPVIFILEGLNTESPLRMKWNNILYNILFMLPSPKTLEYGFVVKKADPNEVSFILLKLLDELKNKVIKFATDKGLFLDVDKFVSIQDYFNSKRDKTAKLEDFKNDEFYKKLTGPKKTLKLKRKL